MVRIHEYTCLATAWKVPTPGVGDVAEVDADEVPVGQVAVDVVVNGTGYGRAGVVEACAAVHGDVAHVRSNLEGS